MLKNKKTHKKMIKENHKKILNYTKESFLKKIINELNLIDSFHKV